jgi:hypothetical protein
MSVQTTIAAPTRRQRRWLLIAAVALGAATIGAVLAIAVNDCTQKADSSIATPALTHSSVPSIMKLTPARLAAGALGLGYALPSAQRGATTASILASMSPETRRYTEAVMAMTFEQLAAGAAGTP